MKVVAFNGSARANGNTRIAIETLFEELHKEGIKTDLVSLAECKIHGCAACFKCVDNQDKQCAVDDDDANDMIAKMLSADGIVMASPVYFASMSSEMKALIDRAGLVAKANSSMFARKVGASIAIARRAGAVSTFDEINRFFFISEMIVPGSTYWNVGFGRTPGEVEKDEEGIMTFRNLGRNMAWLLKKIQG
jgi:multimeric flavodoxin WrbA